MPWGSSTSTFNTGSAAMPNLPDPSFGPAFSAEPSLLAGNVYGGGAPSASFSSAPPSAPLPRSYPTPGGNFPVPGAVSLNNPDNHTYRPADFVAPHGSGFLKRLFGNLLGAVPGAIGSIAHLGSQGIGSILNRGNSTGSSTPPPTIMRPGGIGFDPGIGTYNVPMVRGEISLGGSPTGIDPNTGHQIYNPNGYIPTPVSSAGAPSTIAGNQQTNFQTGFQNMQAAANSPSPFYHPEELHPNRSAIPNVSMRRPTQAYQTMQQFMAAASPAAPKPGG